MLGRKHTSDEELDGFIFCEFPVEPREDGVGVDVVIELSEKIPEYETLITRAVGGHPQPPVSKIVVDEKNITLLKPVRDTPSVSAKDDKILKEHKESLGITPCSYCPLT